MTAELCGAFTFSGNRRALLGLIARWRAAGAALVLVALTDPAGARPQSGPTSSASVSISVSVARKFGLGAQRSATTGVHSDPSRRGEFCVVTNGRSTLLPVLLVRPSSGWPGLSPHALESAVPLGWCGLNGGTFATKRLDNFGEAPELLIIRPE